MPCHVLSSQWSLYIMIIWLCKDSIMHLWYDMIRQAKPYFMILNLAILRIKSYQIARLKHTYLGCHITPHCCFSFFNIIFLFILPHWWEALKLSFSTFTFIHLHSTFLPLLFASFMLSLSLLSLSFLDTYWFRNVEVLWSWRPIRTERWKKETTSHSFCMLNCLYLYLYLYLGGRHVHSTYGEYAVCALVSYLISPVWQQRYPIVCCICM